MFCLGFTVCCQEARGVAGDNLEGGWQKPPLDARLRAYWWWLNGNVTKEAITRDLEAMKTKGFGGALICDAGGAEQDGNDRVPHGPTFLTPEWRELYKHALREADRLGLEMSLNILSGWNLGGPSVTADDAAKKLTWSEHVIQDPGPARTALPAPKSRDNYYRDLFVVAYRLPGAAKEAPSVAVVLTASSSQSGHPPRDAGDDNPDTFWVSDSTEPGKGPSRENPQSIQFEFKQTVAADKLTLMPRPGYGPREMELQVSSDGKAFARIQAFAATEKGPVTVSFPRTEGRIFRLLLFGAHDPNSPAAPRNVQIAELRLSGPEGSWPAVTRPERRLKNWEQKAMHRSLHSSAPNTAPLFEEDPALADVPEAVATEVFDLTAKLNQDGILEWAAPPGRWQVLRFGCTIGDHSRVSTASEGWSGFALDVLDAGAFTRYWDQVVALLIRDAGPLAGKSLKYLHTDSWEVEAVNWTPTLRQEFKQRRGYDFLPYLPALTGRVVDSAKISNRFLHDFRKTLGDLAIDNHFRIFRDRAHQQGLLFHPESGGPHAVPIDAQRCLSWNDAPMSEFWAWSWRHRVGDENRFFVKQPASAAHIGGHKLVLAEGFTTIGPHWQETIWDNLKPSFDKAICEGLNLLVWHAFVCSPQEMGIPGQQYFAGTHFNPNTTWWSRSEAFLGYINRAQHLMQQGLPVMDVAYYYGDHVPNFAQLKRSDPAGILPGYDYDVITEEALLTRAKVKDGRLVLPDGMSYRLLVMPGRTMVSLPVLAKVRDLVADGLTVTAPKPSEASTLRNYPQCDQEVVRIADEMWGDVSGAAEKQRTYKRGRVVWGMTAREVLAADGVAPDFAFSGASDAMIDYFHRRAGAVEIYFVANRSNRWETIEARFRVADKAPELWDLVTGKRAFASSYRTDGEVTSLPLRFTPCGSWAVIFREPAAQHPAKGESNWAEFTPVGELAGPWQVAFDPQWGGPASAEFSSLISWTRREEPGIRFYSGTATYRKEFDRPAALREGQKVWLDLGDLRELAEVRLNGRPLGILWSPPFQVELGALMKPTGNKLEVDIVNFWPNRIIGDDSQPPEKRLTRTNVRKLTAATPLMESGLFGPVRFMIEK